MQIYKCMNTYVRCWFSCFFSLTKYLSICLSIYLSSYLSIYLFIYIYIDIDKEYRYIDIDTVATEKNSSHFSIYCIPQHIGGSI